MLAGRRPTASGAATVPAWWLMRLACRLDNAHSREVSNAMVWLGYHRSHRLCNDDPRTQDRSLEVVRTGTILSATILTALLSSYGVRADDVSGANRMLCSVLEAHACAAGSDCHALSPVDLNIPRFIELDAKARRLSTTAASGEERQTVADSLQRTDGRLLLQGHEQGRAFSLMVDEAAGEATFASAAVGRGVVVFAACTPL
jgi:hypothetical protein